MELVQAKKQYPELCIPMVVVPSTISNNVPGTEFSLGCDTSINEIVSVSLVIMNEIIASYKYLVNYHFNFGRRYYKCGFIFYYFFYYYSLQGK